MPNEKRHNQRILFDTPAIVRSNATDWPTTLIDISLQGALIAIPKDWHASKGETCLLKIQLGADIAIQMQTSIAHIETDHIGLHCKHIDIDSITHLRRLLELNLADEELLHRELTALHRD